MKTNQLMLYREIIPLCTQIHTKYVITLCEQRVVFVNIEQVVHILTTGL